MHLILSKNYQQELQWKRKFLKSNEQIQKSTQISSLPFHPITISRLVLKHGKIIQTEKILNTVNLFQIFFGILNMRKKNKNDILNLNLNSYYPWKDYQINKTFNWSSNNDKQTKREKSIPLRHHYLLADR